MAVAAAVVVADPIETPGELTPTSVLPLLLATAMMAIGLTLWIPPTVRYVQQDSFAVYFRPNTWLSMLRHPYVAVWARTAFYGMVLTGIAFLTLVVLALFPMATAAIRCFFGFFMFGMDVALFTMLSMGVAHLIGQAARAVYEYEQRDRQADSAESTPHPA